VTADDLRAFEIEVGQAFKERKIRGPIHLSGGNEDQLIDVFSRIDRKDWVFSTYRSHYHALLHGIPRDKVMAEIMAGRSMNLCFPEYRFYSSAIVGGMLPIAVGVATMGKRVWCFVGDMAASIGIFHDATQYAGGLPITFVVEDNGLSCDTPTEKTWSGTKADIYRYAYRREYPHVGIGEFVQF